MSGFRLSIMDEWAGVAVEEQECTGQTTEGNKTLEWPSVIVV